MGVNVVNYGGKTLVDMRNATATAETVLAGYTAYGADGDLVVGTMTPTLHKTVSVTLSKNLWIDNQQTVSVDFATAEAMVIAGGEPESQEYFDCEVWCSGQDDGRLIFSCTYEPMEDVIANIGMLMTGELVISYARGSTIQLTDAAERKLRGLTIYGKTTQNGTPSPDAPVPLVNVGDGGSIGVNVAGKNLIDFSKRLPGYELTGNLDIDRQIVADGKWYVTDWIPVEPLTQYTVSGLSSTFCLQADKNYNGIKASQVGNTFRTQANVRFLRFNSIQEGYATPQLEKGSTATEYEPYKEPQTLTISTPNGLPGIHVSEGGNYTDENGWQWICDEVDFAGGKYIQRVLRIASYNGETIPGAYMSSTGALTTGATVLYALAKSIIHDLSSEELAQYAALRTYSPSTTIYTNTEADMMVRYVKE